MNEMRKYLNLMTENLGGNKVVYLLTSDGHRDSVNLQKCAVDDSGLKRLLTHECLELGDVVIPGTIEIEHVRSGGWIHFKYKDFDGDIENGKWGFFEVVVV